MRWLVAVALVACGHSSPPPPNHDEPAVHDTRTPIEKRRDAAAAAIAERSVKCEVEDAKADLAAGRTTQDQYNLDTKPEIVEASRKDWIKKLTVPLNSFQVRVLEVCNRDAKTCDELHDCIQHINDKQK